MRNATPTATQYESYEDDRPTLAVGCLPPNRYQRDVFGARVDFRERIVCALRDQAGVIWMNRGLTVHTLATAPVRDKMLKRSYRMLHVAKRLEGCCQNAIVWRTEDGTQARCTEMRCMSKVCPYCHRQRAFEMRRQMAAAIKSLKNRKLLTLTLKSSDAPLRDQLLKLVESFRKLRHRKLWQQCVDVENGGGVCVVEITRNKKTGLWHPHIHAVIGGEYMEQARLSNLWRKITKCSKIIDIRRAEADEAATYLTKHMNVERYLSKEADLDDFTDEAIAEWATEIHGLQFVRTFGPLRDVDLEGATEHALQDDGRGLTWQQVISAATLLHRAQDGDGEANRLYAEWIECRRRREWPAEFAKRLTDYQRRINVQGQGWRSSIDDSIPPPLAAPAPSRFVEALF